jgi:hypothetical protein
MLRKRWAESKEVDRERMGGNTHRHSHYEPTMANTKEETAA